MRPLRQLWKVCSSQGLQHWAQSAGFCNAACSAAATAAAAVDSTSPQTLATAHAPDTSSSSSTDGRPTHDRPASAVYLKTYGCQMNVSDSELVTAILKRHGYHMVDSPAEAGVVLFNTCAIREKAETRIWGRLNELVPREAARQRPKVGLLGCMAERLKAQLIESGLVDVVAGPDAYRDLPRLLADVQAGAPHAINVELSQHETYADLAPARTPGSAAAFVTITRGCNNMCSFCIVPFTRGRERSRPAATIVDEVKRLRDDGVRQVTLLGQNVNSYADFSTVGTATAEADSTDEPGAGARPVYAEGFRSVYVPRRTGALVFSELLDRVASEAPEVRIRFVAPHPKDFGDDCLNVIAEHANICKHLHMPAQSGASSTLERMRRGYSREAYDALIDRTRQRIPGVSFSTDIIVGFCGETEAEHEATVDLLARTRYEQAFLFAYSRREKTHAARHLEDDVPLAVKRRRLREAVAVYREGMAARRRVLHGTQQLVLIEEVQENGGRVVCGGRTDGFQKLWFDAVPLGPFVDGDTHASSSSFSRMPKVGDFVAVKAQVVGDSLKGNPLGLSSISQFARGDGSSSPVV